MTSLKIGSEHKPFFIAEMSGNHNQSLDKALALVEAAADAGADAIKLQTYTADTMTINCDHPQFIISDKNSLWYGQNLYTLYQQAYTPWDWHPIIMEKAKQLGLMCFSTPFDTQAVDFLESLDVPAYKIASFENTDVTLLRAVASTGKPVIVSTGVSTLSDLELTVSTLREANVSQLILLKCTSAYPTSPKLINLRTIPHLQETFQCEVGLSDHTLGMGVALAAIGLGATVIEKHFVLSRAEGGVDAAFSMEPHEFKQMVEEGARAWESLGKISYQYEATEKKSLQFKRSLYFVKDIAAGEVITTEHVRSIRPGYGLPPQYYPDIIGKIAKRAISRGEPVSWFMLTELQ